MTASPRRRAAIVAAGVLLAAAAAIAFVLATRPPRAAPVNVLLLVMDTTRADRCSLLGHFRATTPALEALAKESIVFEDAWTPAPWTVPAHGALFTGRPPWELGLVKRELLPLPEDVPTLAQILAKAGHATACVTANGWLTPESGLVRGFDAYRCTTRGSEAGPTPENHDIALRWMREQRAAGRPFFLFVNDMDPHAPYDPPGAFIGKIVPKDIAASSIREGRGMTSARSFALSLGVETVDPEFRRAIAALYDAEIAALDAEIGRLLASLRAEGFLDDTLVVIVGDHGEGLGDHGWIEHSFRVDREVMRVPLVVRLPGGLRGGTRVRDVVELQDVFPTVLEVCGVAVPPGLPARSLLGPTGERVAVGLGVASAELREAVAMYTSPEVTAPLKRMRGSVFDGRLHLVTEENAPPRLFDVVDDPGETHDLAAGRAPDVARLLRSLPR